MIKRVSALLWAAVVVVFQDVAAAQQQALTFGEEQIVGREVELGSVLAARVAPDGGVYALDHVNARIVAFAPDGQRRWILGRRGRGPGEFHTPYRLDVRRDGRIFIYDAGTAEVTAVSPEGRYLERYRLPFPLDQVDGLIALDDALLFSGTTTDPAASGNAIHRFRIDGPELRHSGSFGPLPAVRDPMVLQVWGAGSLVRGSTGSIWYTRRLPYEVYRFDPSGRQRAVVRPPFRTRGTPDDAVLVERDTRRTTYSETGAYVEVPGPAWELSGGVLLVTRIRPNESFWDLFSVSGRYLVSQPVPERWSSVAGYDATRGVLWVAGTHQDQPVLYRVSVRVQSRPSPTRRPR
jgi:hypothetical protein